MHTNLGDDNEESGNIESSRTTTVTYDMERNPRGERAQGNDSERLARVLPSISTSAGHRNKGCSNIQDSGSTNITYNRSTGASARHVRKK